MGQAWRLFAGEEIKYALTEGWKDFGDGPDKVDEFLKWVEPQLPEFIISALGLDSEGVLWDKLRDGGSELAQRYMSEKEKHVQEEADGQPGNGGNE